MTKKGYKIKEQLEHMYINKNLSSGQIAKRYNMTREGILYWLHKFKIPKRKNTWVKSTKRYRHRIPNSSKKLTTKKAYILGVLFGDGYINKKRVTISLSVIDKDFALAFKNSLIEVYGKISSFKLVQKKNTQKPQYLVELYSTEVVEDLLRYGEFYGKIWEVPKEILGNPNKKIIGMFLRGLFDSEGSVYIGKRGGYSVEFACRNKKAIKGIEYLLKKLKIKGFLRENGLRIFTKEDITIFKENVGFSIKRKQEKLIKLLNRYVKPSKRHKPKDYFNALNLFKKKNSKRKISKILGIPRQTISSWINNGVIVRGLK